MSWNSTTKTDVLWQKFATLQPLKSLKAQSFIYAVLIASGVKSQKFRNMGKNVFFGAPWLPFVLHQLGSLAFDENCPKIGHFQSLYVLFHYKSVKSLFEKVNQILQNVSFPI